MKISTNFLIKKTRQIEGGSALLSGNVNKLWRIFSPLMQLLKFIDFFTEFLSKTCWHTRYVHHGQMPKRLGKWWPAEKLIRIYDQTQELVGHSRFHIFLFGQLLVENGSGTFGQVCHSRMEQVWQFLVEQNIHYIPIEKKRFDQWEDFEPAYHTSLEFQWIFRTKSNWLGVAGICQNQFQMGAGFCSHAPIETIK